MMAFILPTDFDFIAYMSKMAFFFWKLFSRQWRFWNMMSIPPGCLVGLVVKASTSRAENQGFDSRLRRDFFPGLSRASDFKFGTPVATLPGT